MQESVPSSLNNGGTHVGAAKTRRSVSTSSSVRAPSRGSRSASPEAGQRGTEMTSQTQTRTRTRTRPQVPHHSPTDWIVMVAEGGFDPTRERTPAARENHFGLSRQQHGDLQWSGDLCCCNNCASAINPSPLPLMDRTAQDNDIVASQHLGPPVSVAAGEHVLYRPHDSATHQMGDGDDDDDDDAATSWVESVAPRFPESWERTTAWWRADLD